MPNLDRLPILSPHEGLHHLILELPHVARPAILLQASLRLWSEPAGRKTERMALSPNTMRRKWKNVCGPLAERGKLDVNDFQTKKEVLSKPSAVNFLGEIPVARGDQTKVRTTQTGLAQPPIFFFLKSAQEGGLRSRRKVRDFVEK